MTPETEAGGLARDHSVLGVTVMTTGARGGGA